MLLFCLIKLLILKLLLVHGGPIIFDDAAGEEHQQVAISDSNSRPINSLNVQQRIGYHRSSWDGHDKQQSQSINDEKRQPVKVELRKGGGREKRGGGENRLGRTKTVWDKLNDKLFGDPMANNNENKINYGKQRLMMMEKLVSANSNQSRTKGRPLNRNLMNGDDENTEDGTMLMVADRRFGYINDESGGSRYVRVGAPPIAFQNNNNPLSMPIVLLFLLIVSICVAVVVIEANYNILDGLFRVINLNEDEDSSIQERLTKYGGLRKSSSNTDDEDEDDGDGGDDNDEDDEDGANIKSKKKKKKLSSKRKVRKYNNDKITKFRSKRKHQEKIARKSINRKKKETSDDGDYLDDDSENDIDPLSPQYHSRRSSRSRHHHHRDKKYREDIHSKKHRSSFSSSSKKKMEEKKN